MGVLPEPIEELLDSALVGELTVLDSEGGLVTHPLIPFYDGELIYLTSSVLFFERAVIEIVPRRAFLWEDGRTDRPPQVFELAREAVH